MLEGPHVTPELGILIQCLYIIIFLLASRGARNIFLASIIEKHCIIATMQLTNYF